MTLTAYAVLILPHPNCCTSFFNPLRHTYLSPFPSRKTDGKLGENNQKRGFFPPHKASSRQISSLHQPIQLAACPYSVLCVFLRFLICSPAYLRHFSKQQGQGDAPIRLRVFRTRSANMGQGNLEDSSKQSQRWHPDRFGAQHTH